MLKVTKQALGNLPSGVQGANDCVILQQTTLLPSRARANFRAMQYIHVRARYLGQEGEK
ncbi:MAG: hypothetical protein JO142_12955 [Burkholderiales bacterium]|nr:hypothetical protein [Burkholderiales bacterium]